MANTASVVPKISKMLDRACQSLGRSLKDCWPTAQYEISEANLILHFAKELMSKQPPRRYVFAEPQLYNDRRKHFDLAVWDRQEDWELIVEAKSLPNSDNAGRIVEDIRRMRRARLNAPTGWKSRTRLGIILASQAPYRDTHDLCKWWKKPSAVSPTGRGESANWKALATELKKAKQSNAVKGSCCNDREAWDVHLVWAIFDLRSRK